MMGVMPKVTLQFQFIFLLKIRTTPVEEICVLFSYQQKKIYIFRKKNKKPESIKNKNKRQISQIKIIKRNL